MNQEDLAKAYKWAIIGAGALVWLICICDLRTGDLDQRFLFLALITLGCGSRITIRIPRVKGLISVSDTFIFLAVLLFDKNAAVLLAGAEGLCSSVRFSKKFTTVLFNSAVMSCATFLAASAVGSVYGATPFTRSIGDFVAALTLLAFVQYATNSGIVAVGAALMTDQPLWTTWKDGFLWTSLTYFAGASAAGVAGKLIEVVGFYAVLATAPVIAVVYFTYCTYLKNIEASKSQAEQAERHMLALRESEERFRSAFDHAAGMALVAPDGKWIQVNRSLSDILGYSEQELLNIDFQSVTHHSDLNSVLEQLNKLQSGATTGLQMEKRFLHKNGDVIWVLLSVTGVHHSGQDSRNFIFQIQDITDRKRAEERLVHDAFHDALTGLPNRVLFMDHLKQSLGRARGRKHLPFAVLFLDFDRFKLINDSLGHMVGDQLLIAIAGRLKANVRPGDTVARLGGDEFTILLEDLNQSNEVEVVAARLLKSLSMPFNLSGHEVFTTASIGIAHSTMGYHYAEDMLRDADIAMYRAKTLGKARFEIFDPSMHANAVNLLRIETDLWRAIERDELYLEYQPIVSLQTGKIAGFEALIRWQHPSLGVVPPSEFIAVAEETGLIVPIGTWILEEAARQIRRWRDSEINSDVFISVNLSAKQFMKSDFASDVRRIINTMEISPANIKLEITESMVMNKVESTITMLKQLKEIGVETSIDDFGTGYSSLSYLPRFPISTLKVDRSFVNSICENHENLEIVRTIIMLAHNLRMKVIAEGVESSEQITQLRMMKCELAQGFFFSRPLSGEEAMTLIKDDNVYPMIPLDRVIEYVEGAIA